MCRMDDRVADSSGHACLLVNTRSSTAFEKPVQIARAVALVVVKPNRDSPRGADLRSSVLAEVVKAKLRAVQTLIKAGRRARAHGRDVTPNSRGVQSASGTRQALQVRSQRHAGRIARRSGRNKDRARRWGCEVSSGTTPRDARPRIRTTRLAWLWAFARERWRRRSRLTTSSAWQCRPCWTPGTGPSLASWKRCTNCVSTAVRHSSGQSRALAGLASGRDWRLAARTGGSREHSAWSITTSPTSSTGRSAAGDAFSIEADGEPHPEQPRDSERGDSHRRSLGDRAYRDCKTSGRTSSIRLGRLAKACQFWTKPWCRRRPAEALALGAGLVYCRRDRTCQQAYALTARVNGPRRQQVVRPAPRRRLPAVSHPSIEIMQMAACGRSHQGGSARLGACRRLRDTGAATRSFRRPRLHPLAVSWRSGTACMVWQRTCQ